MRIAVAVCVDVNLINRISHVYNSVLRHTGEVDFYVVCDKGIPAPLIQKLPQKYRVIAGVDMPEIDMQAQRQDHRLSHAKAMFYRFLLPDLIGTDKVIYLDNDVVVVGDLHEMWELDLGNHYVAAVSSTFQRTLSQNWKALATAPPPPAGVDMEAIVFNSGTLMFNSPLWRQDCVTEKIIQIVRDYPMFDQIALNVACQGKIYELSQEWCMPANCLKGRELYLDGNLMRVYGSPKIYHWHGANKPWAHTCNFQEVYEAYV